MISVVTAASSAVGRAGLVSLVGELPGFAVAASASSGNVAEVAAEVGPDTILWQLAADEDAGSLARLRCWPVVLLTADAAAGLLRAGANGVLPLEATAEQIRIGLEAAVAGLAVFMPQTVVRQTGRLTGRETEVLRMIADGLANKEIAWKLGISEHTVKFHVSALLGKLGAASRAEAVGAGIRQGAILV
jgi:DNA-binding NarL/FixJ family response regulator